MQKITVVKSFRHMDLWAHEARTYAPGSYTVVDFPARPDECSKRCAEVALAEGWAHEAEAEKPARPTGSPTGGGKQPASSRQAPRSRKGKSKK